MVEYYGLYSDWCIWLLFCPCFAHGTSSHSRTTDYITMFSVMLSSAAVSNKKETVITRCFALFTIIRNCVKSIESCVNPLAHWGLTVAASGVMFLFDIFCCNYELNIIMILNEVMFLYHSVLCFAFLTIMNDSSTVSVISLFHSFTIAQGFFSLFFIVSFRIFFCLYLLHQILIHTHN